MASRIRLMLADDHQALRGGLLRLFAQHPDIEVVGQAASGDEVIRESAACRPQVLACDIRMPGLSGLEAVQYVLARDPGLRVVVYSMYEDASFAAQAYASGARGYVAKSDDPDELVQAVRAVHAGRIYISHGMAERYAFHTIDNCPNPLVRLSPREFEIFRLLAEGCTLDTVASRMRLSQKTVANHQTAIRHKLGIATSVDLVRLAIRHQVITP